MIFYSDGGLFLSVFSLNRQFTRAERHNGEMDRPIGAKRNTATFSPSLAHLEQSTGPGCMIAPATTSYFSITSESENHFGHRPQC
jgi:hypothetical protein